MDFKQQSSKRKKAIRRWRVFFMIAGSIGVGIMVLGFTISLNDEGQPVSKFYTAGLALATLAAAGYGLAGVKLRLWPRKRKRRRRRSRSENPPDIEPSEPRSPAL